MALTAPGIWTDPDGYRVARHTYEDGWVAWRVFRPDAGYHCAEVAYLREARGFLAVLKKRAKETPDA